MKFSTKSRYALRLWDVAKEFVLCDNFFQGAFGGSFLNHQYLISATAPVYPNAAQSVAKAQIATLQSDDPSDTRLKPLNTSPASAKSSPKPTLRRPGTKKAMRQPEYWMSKPVMPAAAATPRLPASPLRPITQPGRCSPCTSMSP